MNPAEARDYVKLAIGTSTGQAMIRKAYPNDAVTIIGTGGDAMDDDAIVQIAATVGKTLRQTYDV